MTSSPDRAGLPVALLVSVLLMIGVAGIGIAAGPDVVSPDVTSLAAPEELTVPEEEPAQGEETANETYLREALGFNFVIDGDELIAVRDDGLPDELTAHASVVVLPSGDDKVSCIFGGNDAGADGVPMDECDERTVPGRGSIFITTVGPRHSAAGSNFGDVTIRRLRADGNVVVVQLFVLGKPAEGSTTELERDATDWLKSQGEALIAAAFDDRMRPAPA